MKLNFDQETGHIVFEESVTGVYFVTKNGERLSVDMEDNEIVLHYEGILYYNRDGKIVSANSQKEKESIDTKIRKLRHYTENFPYIEYYPHESGECYKINNEYTNFKENKIILGRVDERFDKILNRAIESISKKKEDYENLPF